MGRDQCEYAFLGGDIASQRLRAQLVIALHHSDCHLCSFLEPAIGKRLAFALRIDRQQIAMTMNVGLVLFGATLLAVIGFQRRTAGSFENMADTAVLAGEPVRLEHLAVPV